MSNVPPEIMNHLRAQADVGSDNLEHLHHLRTKPEKPTDEAELPTQERVDPPLGIARKRLQQLGLRASGILNPKE